MGRFASAAEKRHPSFNGKDCSDVKQLFFAIDKADSFRPPWIVYKTAQRGGQEY